MTVVTHASGIPVPELEPHSNARTQPVSQGFCWIHDTSLGPYCKVKVKVPLEEATKAHSGRRGIALLFL